MVATGIPLPFIVDKYGNTYLFTQKLSDENYKSMVNIAMLVC